MDSSALTTVFSKQPVPGLAKTRLVPPLDPREAARLARAMLDDTVARHLGEPGSQRVALTVDPSESVEWFRARYPGVESVEAQRGAALGERLADWFERALVRAPSVVVVGADCPLLPRRLVATAHARLAEGADAVFAPDAGGGYVLVGLAAPAPELFLDVPMSTSDNLSATLDRAARAGLSVELLPEQLDVDDETDLVALARELNTLRELGRVDDDFPQATYAVLQDVLVGSGASR